MEGCTCRPKHIVTEPGVGYRLVARFVALGRDITIGNERACNDGSRNNPRSTVFTRLMERDGAWQFNR